MPRSQFTTHKRLERRREARKQRRQARQETTAVTLPAAQAALAAERERATWLAKFYPGPSQ